MQISDTLMESVNELNDWGWVPNPLTAALQTEIAQRLLKTTYDYETLDQFTAEVNLRDALVGGLGALDTSSVEYNQGFRPLGVFAYLKWDEPYPGQ